MAVGACKIIECRTYAEKLQLKATQSNLLFKFQFSDQWADGDYGPSTDCFIIQPARRAKWIQ